MEDDSVEYKKTIHEDNAKGVQLNLVVSNFRDVSYLHIRKYYQTYEGEWVPSKEGVSMPVTIVNVQNLLNGLVDICAVGEASHLLEDALLKLKEKST